MQLALGCRGTYRDHLLFLAYLLHIMQAAQGMSGMEPMASRKVSLLVRRWMTPVGR